MIILPMWDRFVKKRLDQKTSQSLWENSKYFIKVLGEPREEGNDFIFPLKDLPFTGFKIGYDIENKFLGKIYVMVLEGKLAGQKNFYSSEKIELRYSGLLRKGKPFFISVSSKRTEKNENILPQFLNQDKSLIEKCWKLDLEFLRIFFDVPEEVWKIQVSPYGGSFIQMIFPPIRYNVILVKEQAELILLVMKKIAQVINSKYGVES